MNNLNEPMNFNFIRRLQSLQMLCSSPGDGSTSPECLVFVPGLDGKGNKGSLMIMKYLFQGACGKELYDGILDDDFEPIEEIILVVQFNCVSIFCRLLQFL